MKKGLFLLTLCNSLLGLACANAQLVNGTFTSGYSGWTLVGPDPATFAPDSSSPPAGFSYDALIDSTSSGIDSSSSATTAQIATALGLSSALPGSPNSSLTVDGEAFYQTFTLAAPSTLTFQYKSTSNDEDGFDVTGYALSGGFHALPLDGTYSTVGPIALGPGTYTLGFTAYNTGDDFSRTFLNVGDIQIADAPELSSWLMLTSGLAVFAWMGLVRRLAANPRA